MIFGLVFKCIPPFEYSKKGAMDNDAINYRIYITTTHFSITTTQNVLFYTKSDREE